MFDLGSIELFFIAIIILVVVGPRDLPRLMRMVGRFVGQVRGTARHFKTGLDAMMREAELEEMQKKWDQHNADIMTGAAVADDDGEAASDRQQRENTGNPPEKPAAP